MHTQYHEKKKKYNKEVSYFSLRMLSIRNFVLDLF